MASLEGAGLHVLCVDVVAAAANRITAGISALLQHRGRQVWKRAFCYVPILMKGVNRHTLYSTTTTYSGTATWHLMQ